MGRDETIPQAQAIPSPPDVGFCILADFDVNLDSTEAIPAHGERIIVDPKWLTAAVVGLANVIINDRAFERLPILADALEEAGCNNTDILNHCRFRGPSPHLRTCWVVDLLLGKS
jgi:hypothetical protein